MLKLDGQPFTLEQIARIARGVETPLALAPAARERMNASRRVVESIIEQGETVYGVNTGFGKLSDVSIKRDDLRQLQLNLVRSHACGVGRPLSPEETRAMLFLRANVLALGFSGARSLIAEMLVKMLERDVLPVVPEKVRSGRAATSLRSRILPSPLSAKAKLFIEAKD